MSTAVAPVTAAPLSTPHADRPPSPKSFTSRGPVAVKSSSTSTPSKMSSGSHDDLAPTSSPDSKRSPPSNNSTSGPKIVVKEEPPTSPSLTSQSRPRPRRLDLKISNSTGGLTVRPPNGPMTARDGLGLQEMGLACLSPGFQTQDPVLKEQLQRSITVREQQRSIIESRLQKTAKGDGPDGIKPSESNLFGSSRLSKKRPPPGLSIVPPSASQFANERVIQSAPLNQTFTGRHDPLTRHIINQTPNHSSTSHIHHVPANQTNNRLPPLSDIIGSDLGGRDHERDSRFFQHAPPAPVSQTGHMPPTTSPPHNSSQVPSKRPREYRSAEEAVHELSGGREELLPRIVHYSGHQPTTPPTPVQALDGAYQSHAGPTSNAQPQPQSLPQPTHGRRRTRQEYEQDSGSPPLGSGPDMRFRNGPGPAVPTYGPFGADRDSPETQRKKKDEFLGLCSRAWDLFHS